MKLFKRLIFSLPLIIMGGLMASCEDRTPIDNEEAQKHEEMINQQLSDMDQVKTTYNGEVALIDVSSENLMPYFQKRMSNTTTDITEHTDVVLLSEQGANRALNNEDFFNKLQNHWKKNKPIGVLSPSENTIKLIAKFNGENNKKVEKEEIASIEQYAFYMLKSDGNAISYCKPDVSDVMIQLVDTSGVEHEKEKVETQNIEVSDYSRGRIAERAAEWLNTSQSSSNQLRTLNSSLNGVTYEAFTQKFYRPITVDHDYIVNKSGSGEGCGTSTTEAVLELKVYAGFDPVTKQDVYDMTVSEVFDASRSYIENRYVKEYAAYKNKYTGGNYAGVTVALRLNNVNGSDISFTDAAPIATGGSYSVSHTPASMTVGGGITPGVTPSGPTLSGNLCFSYTPPKTSVSMSYNELPVQYNDFHTFVEWDYGMPISDYPKVYDANWGFNADFLGVFGFSKGSCQTQQAVTYKLNNTEKYEGQPINLWIQAIYKTYHAVNSVFDGTMSCYLYHYNNFYIILPQVCRHFEKYSPYCYDREIIDATENWQDVEYELKNNSNYKLLYNDNLQIGSPVTGGVEKEATKIWEEIINSLINTTRKNTAIKNKYVVALADGNGNTLKNGLYIDGSNWTYVDDITKVDLGN